MFSRLTCSLAFSLKDSLLNLLSSGSLWIAKYSQCFFRFVGQRSYLRALYQEFPLFWTFLFSWNECRILTQSVRGQPRAFLRISSAAVFSLKKWPFFWCVFLKKENAKETPCSTNSDENPCAILHISFFFIVFLIISAGFPFFSCFAALLFFWWSSVY